jgi:hypothetical protein
MRVGRDGFTAGELGVELLGLPPAGVRREHAEVYAPVFLLPVHGVVEEDHLEAADHGGGDAVVISAGVEQHQHPGLPFDGRARQLWQSNPLPRYRVADVEVHRVERSP